MARVTRLELATSGVTGRRSNQLSYTPSKSFIILDRGRKCIGQEKNKRKIRFSKLIYFIFNNWNKIKIF